MKFRVVTLLDGAHEQVMLVKEEEDRDVWHVISWHKNVEGAREYMAKIRRSVRARAEI